MSPARILVVDDNTADVSLLRVGLEQQQGVYQLEVLKTGEEALQFVQNHREGVLTREPCVILLDLHLPRYDGLSLLHAIKAAPQLSHIHVMVLSGAASPQEKISIAALGATYREKPFNLDDYADLAAEILEICERSSAAAA